MSSSPEISAWKSCNVFLKMYSIHYIVIPFMRGSLLFAMIPALEVAPQVRGRQGLQCCNSGGCSLQRVFMQGKEK